MQTGLTLTIHGKQKSCAKNKCALAMESVAITQSTKIPRLLGMLVAGISLSILSLAMPRLVQ
jgi:ABC-type enterochelin transport system permease subunit